MNNKALAMVIWLLVAHSIGAMVEPAEAASARGGASDDFSIESISLGNQTVMPFQWTNPDGVNLDYVIAGESIEISVEVSRGGSGFVGNDGISQLDVIHPIGYVMESFTWITADLYPGNSQSHKITWTPTVAHSILNNSTNELTGGIMLKASVNYAPDDINGNDEMTTQVPVAVLKDPMDVPANTQNQDQFFAGRYPSEGGQAFATGIWQDENSGGAVGDGLWRHSNPGADYPANAHDRAVYGYFTQQTNQCESGYNIDSGLAAVYGVVVVCKRALNSFNFVSLQLHAQAWGDLGSGDDYAGIELWRGAGGPQFSMVHQFELNDPAPVNVAGSWTNITWDPTEELGGYNWNLGFLFHSDGGGATSGFRVDDFVVFGVEKVDNFTIDVDCINPENGIFPIDGYTTYPNNIVSLKCMVTNNGYRSASVRVQSNVTNTDWMNQSSIRIEVEGASGTGTSVLMPPLKPSEPIETWVNLTIPPGSDVQQQLWNVWWQDAGGTASGIKAYYEIELEVKQQFSVYMTTDTPTIAASLGPGEAGSMPFTLQNSGNRDASFKLTSNFFGGGDGWDASFVFADGGTYNPLSQIPITRGESVDMFFNFTAPLQIAPEEYPFSISATCPSCGDTLFGNKVLSKKVNIPVYREATLTTFTESIIAPADGIQKSINLELHNLGNAEETYLLSITQSNNKLQAYLNKEVSALLEPWDVAPDSNIKVLLPMPIGLQTGFYFVTVTAINTNDSSVRAVINLEIEVVDTAAVQVRDEISLDSYTPNGPSVTMPFNVTNTGNNPDRFVMSMEIPEGMSANFEQLVDSKTKVLNPGESMNVLVRFSFSSEAQGTLKLKVTATSENDQNISSTGNCEFLVGSQNWLRIISIERPIYTEAGEYEVVVTVRNQYSDNQSVDMSLEKGDSRNYFSSSIASRDLNFLLAVGAERDVTITLDIPDSSIENLLSDEITVNLTIWATSGTVSESVPFVLEVSLVKTAKDLTVDRVESSTSNVGAIATWAVGGLLIIGLAVVLIRILNATEEEDTGWTDQEYEDHLAAKYGAVTAAPSLDAPTSFASQTPAYSPPSLSDPAPVAASVPIPQSPPPSSAAPVVQPTPPPAAVPQVPPLPPEGLPPGWTMEQWEAYGSQWLASQGR